MNGSRVQFHGAVLAVSLLFLLLTGCDRYQEGFEKGHEEGYADGLKQGFEAGVEQGHLQGQAEGNRRAEETAAQGTAVRFYLKPFFFLCAGGIATGIGLQYMLLHVFRKNSHLSWIGVTLVPGLADSRCFRLQSRLGILALEEKRQLEEVRTRTKIRNAQIESIKTTTQSKMEASSDLESALLRIMLKEADRKMQGIIDDAERQRSSRPPRAGSLKKRS